MSEKTKRFYLLYLLTVPVVAIVTVTLRSIALLTEYEAAIGFYATPSYAVATASLLLAVAALLAVFTHELRGLFVFSVDYRDLPTLFAGSYLGLALPFFAVTLVLGAWGAASLTLAVAGLSAIAACLGASLFAVRGFDGSARGTRKAMLTLALAFFPTLFVLYLGFEGSIMIYAPVKLLATATWLFATFFFLGEARIALDRPKWALHTYTTVMTAVLAATLSLPNLIYHAVRGESLIGNTAHDFLALALLLYTTARLVAAFSSAARQGTAEMTYATGFTAAAREADKEPTATEGGDTDEEAADR